MASWDFGTTLTATTMNNSLIKMIQDRLDADSGSPTGSITSFTEILPRILEFLLPGYGFLCNTLLNSLGINVNLVLWTVVGFYVLTQLKNAFLVMMDPLIDRCIYEFTFDDENRAYEAFISWAKERDMGLKQRSVQLDVFGTTYDAATALKDFDPLSDQTIHTRRQRMQLLPSFGSHWFWYSKLNRIFTESC